MRIALAALLLLGARTAVVHAEPEATTGSDGYCDFVEGVAAAESAVLLSPEVFGEIGRIEQPSSSAVAGVDAGTERFIGGVRYRLNGIYEGFATRGRAKAECRRHTALEHIRGETLYRALDARAQIIDGALAEANKLLAQVTADLEARRTTAQEATAMRLRVEDLRRIATETHQAMSALPQPSGGTVGLTAFQQADDDVEQQDAKLRRARAFDVSVRAGVDTFLNGSGDNSSPYFAVLSVGINLGVLWQHSGNARAADGRRRFVRSGRDPLTVDATADRLRALAETATRRAAETGALEADLGRQMEVLNRVGGEDSKRYRQTVWFDWIKIRAERAFHEAHAAALKQVLGAS
jgi:hypothetical protein